MNGGHSGGAGEAAGPEQHKGKRGSSASPGTLGAWTTSGRRCFCITSPHPDLTPRGRGRRDSYDFCPRSVPASHQVTVTLLSRHLSSSAKTSPAPVCGNEAYSQAWNHLPRPLLTVARNQIGLQTLSTKLFEILTEVLLRPNPGPVPHKGNNVIACP